MTSTYKLKNIFNTIIMFQGSLVKNYIEETIYIVSYLKKSRNQSLGTWVHLSSASQYFINLGFNIQVGRCCKNVLYLIPLIGQISFI